LYYYNIIILWEHRRIRGPSLTAKSLCGAPTERYFLRDNYDPCCQWLLESNFVVRDTITEFSTQIFCLQLSITDPWLSVIVMRLCCAVTLSVAVLCPRNYIFPYSHGVGHTFMCVLTSCFMSNVGLRKRDAKVWVVGEYLGLRTDLWNLARLYVEGWPSMSGPPCNLYKMLTWFFSTVMNPLRGVFPRIW